MKTFPITEVLMQGGVVLTLYGVSQDELLKLGHGSMPERMAKRYPNLRPVSIMNVREKTAFELSPR